MHKYSSAVTLTYDDENLPMQGQLVYRDFQKFLKRVRRKLGPFRFYMCGEYGDELGRPHFHAVLFGVHFADRAFFKKAGDGSNLYTSAVLSGLWKAGHATCGDFSPATAAYIARYVTKKVFGQNAKEHYTRVSEWGELVELEPEFTRMSLGGRAGNGGIGASFFRKYFSEITVRDGVVVNGRVHQVPRAFDLMLEELDADASDEIKFDRYKKAIAMAEDCTAERLAVQEHVQKAKLALKRRSL